MRLSTDTIRRMVRDTYGEHLSDDEIERLMPYLEQHFEVMRQLQALDLGTGDPVEQSYVEDRRVSP